jgi:hypothetical protein
MRFPESRVVPLVQQLPENRFLRGNGVRRPAGDAAGGAARQRSDDERAKSHLHLFLSAKNRRFERGMKYNWKQAAALSAKFCNKSSKIRKIPLFLGAPVVGWRQNHL